jgi:hypothetical protein
VRSLFSTRGGLVYKSPISLSFHFPGRISYSAVPLFITPMFL